MVNHDDQVLIGSHGSVDSVPVGCVLAFKALGRGWAQGDYQFGLSAMVKGAR